MKVKLIAIGNSRGIRLPASVIKECELGEELELRVENGNVVISRLSGARDGWEAAFKNMATAGDDAPLMDETLDNAFDIEEWTW